jgi:hypothetical protein
MRQADIGFGGLFGSPAIIAGRPHVSTVANGTRLNLGLYKPCKPALTLLPHPVPTVRK